MRHYLIPTTWAALAVLALVLFGLFPRQTTARTPRILHVVTCGEGSTASRCEVSTDRSFDAAGLSEREVRRQTQARHMANEVELRAAATLKDMELLNCGKITKAEYMERRSGPSGVDIRHRDEPAAACDFGDPDCANCWTYFDGPGGGYCTYACINCQSSGPIGGGKTRERWHR